MEGGFTEKVRGAGGEIYAITSEPQELASRAGAEWELDFETVGDPHHEISGECRRAGFLELIVNTDTARFEEDPDSPYRHPKGYFQPGVLALSSEERILYRWRSRPTRENMGGATNRPTADHVFENVLLALEEGSSDESIADADLDENPRVNSREMPWFLAVWIAAAVTLPKVWVGASVLLWLGWITPQVLKISRKFQPVLPER